MVRKIKALFLSLHKEIRVTQKLPGVGAESVFAEGIRVPDTRSSDLFHLKPPAAEAPLCLSLVSKLEFPEYK